MPKTIGLLGLAGAGKSTVAEQLTNLYGYKTIPFAAPLKRMVKALGLVDADLTGAKKEEPMMLLCWKSPRQVMQTLGTEWGRNLVGANLWVGAWAYSCEGRRVVADDVRFENEVHAIKRRDGVTIRVIRPGHSITSNEHASENNLDGYIADYVIMNTGTREELRSEICRVMREYQNANGRRAQARTTGETGDLAT
jgi:hypothetical protein